MMPRAHVIGGYVRQDKRVILGTLENDAHLRPFKQAVMTLQCSL